MTFTIIDTQTGLPPDLPKIASEERWARTVDPRSVSLVVSQAGWVFMFEAYGRFRACPAGRFDVRER